MRILFMGSPEFAVGSLDSLIKAGHTIVAAVSQPDKPKGRGYNLVPTAVKEFALSKELLVYTPETMKDEAFLPELKKLDPECIVVVAYGKILPSYILDYPKYGCVNIHASLLPKYRGAAPINFVIINGEKKTGVTTMLMDKGIDTGDMLLKAETAILPEDNAETLHDRLSAIGADLIVETLDKLEKNLIIPQKQEGETCYAPLIDSSVKHINFADKTDNIINLIRGLSPFPTAFASANGKNIKIFEAEKAEIKDSADKGFGCLINEKDMIIKTGDSAVRILSLAPEGKKRMSGQDFLRGLQDKNGFRLS